MPVPHDTRIRTPRVYCFLEALHNRFLWKWGKGGVWWFVCLVGECWMMPSYDTSSSSYSSSITHYNHSYRAVSLCLSLCIKTTNKKMLRTNATACLMASTNKKPEWKHQCPIRSSNKKPSNLTQISSPVFCALTNGVLPMALFETLHLIFIFMKS